MPQPRRWGAARCVLATAYGSRCFRPAPIRAPRRCCSCLAGACRPICGRRICCTPPAAALPGRSTRAATANRRSPPAATTPTAAPPTCSRRSRCSVARSSWSRGRSPASSCCTACRATARGNWPAWCWSTVRSAKGPPAAAPAPPRSASACATTATACSTSLRAPSFASRSPRNALPRWSPQCAGCRWRPACRCSTGA